jgi:hypothetical protein
VVELAIERASLRDLALPALDVPEEELELTHAGLALDPCADGKAKLRLTLDPHESVDVHATATTAVPGGRAGGAAAMHIIDRRRGKVAGGVMFVCVDRPGPEAPGQTVATAKPCPVALAEEPYAVDVDADPTATRRRLTPGATFVFVVPVTNPTRSRLGAVTVYLEHLGISDAAFLPVTWNVGTLAPGDVFYAAWTIVDAGSATGTFEASAVVQSKGRDATRLAAPFTIGRARQRPDARTRRSGHGDRVRR